jgi:hypothetical protein
MVIIASYSSPRYLQFICYKKAWCQTSISNPIWVCLSQDRHSALLPEGDRVTQWRKYLS